MSLMYSIDVAGDTVETPFLTFKDKSCYLSLLLPLFSLLNMISSTHHPSITDCVLSLNWRDILILILFDLSRIELNIIDLSYFLETLYSLGLSDTALFLFSLPSFWSFPSTQLCKLVIFYKVARHWCSSML